MTDAPEQREEIARLLGRDVVARLGKTSQREDLVVCVKHSRRFLPRLRALAQSFPQAAIFVLVRNPFDTLRDWKTAPHLIGLPGASDDPWTGLDPAHLTEEQRAHWLSLGSLGDEAIQRAGLWDCLAELADAHADNIHILRYEDMQRQPQAIMRYAYATLFSASAADLPDPASAPLPEARGALSAWEIECIQAICTRTAGIFDYNLYDLPETAGRL